MRRIALFASLLTLLAAVPMYAERGQSYFTADDGGTVVRQQEDGREVDARINMPVFPGDQVVTNRHGRSEIRLSDGNVIALDRSTSVRFRSILDAFDGDGSQTIVELRYGHVAVQRTDYGREYLRVDTDTASYLATTEAIYAVDTDRGRDRVTVFDGAVEIRTPQTTERVRAGEEARVDDQGVYSKVSQSVAVADDFERWFLRRSERYGSGSSRYLDRSLAYADSELSEYGSWTYISGFGAWGWRPRVGAGWRPYYYGEWMGGPSGCLVWVSYEPWGWVPYHYGRWGYDPIYGWVWLPGSGYSPAWVYWMYGSGFVGWAPAGWWDIYQPYYNWCYRPYTRASWDNGWWGQVRGRDIDYRPWTFMYPNKIVGTRVDTGAVTTDLIRQRLQRGGDVGGAVVSNGPARFTRNDLRDPSQAVNNIMRRGMGGGTSGSSGATDMTPFIRRDPNLTPAFRDRVARMHPVNTPPQPVGSVAPIGTGNVAPIGGGLVAPIGRNGSDTGNPPATWDGRFRRDGQQPADGGNTGGVRRGNDTPSAPAAGTIDRGSRGSGREPVWRGGDTPSSGGTIRRGNDGGRETPAPAPSAPAPVWRDRIQRPSTPAPSAPSPDQAQSAPRSDWRSRSRSVESPGGRTPSGDSRVDRGAADVPRRVIDRIGGPRVVPSTPQPSVEAPPPPQRYERFSQPRIERPSSPQPAYQPPSRIERSYTPPPAPAPVPQRQEAPPSSSSHGEREQIQRH